jgi:transposase
MDAPEENSTDLTDEQVIKAILTTNEDGVVSKLSEEHNCPECGTRMHVEKHSLRRRTPHLYWIAWMACEAGHPVSITFRADWVKTT